MLSGKSVPIPLHPCDSKFLQIVKSPRGQLEWVPPRSSTGSEQQACGLTAQQEIILNKTSCPNIFFGVSKMGPLTSSKCQLPLRIKLLFKKRKIRSNKERTVSQWERHKCTHLAHSANGASRFVLFKRKLASLASKQPQSGEINTENAKS